MAFPEVTLVKERQRVMVERDREDLEPVCGFHGGGADIRALPGEGP